MELDKKEVKNMSCGKRGNACILFLHYGFVKLYSFNSAEGCPMLEPRHLNNNYKYMLHKFRFCPQCGRKLPQWNNIRNRIKKSRGWITEQRRTVWTKKD